MAKNSKSSDKNAAMIIVLILVAFVAGFLIARARYKPQLSTTYNMVMERESTISGLKAQLKETQNQLKLLENLVR